MDILELRKIVSNFPKFPGTKVIKPVSVCNKGFPGTFNLSFIESEWLREFHGQYMNYDHDFIVSKIQPCIRHQDWEIIKSDSTNRYRYLAVFDMADIGGVIHLVDGARIEEVVKFSIGNFYNFLVNQINLSPEKLRVVYSDGGKINELTKGKYPLNKYLERDVFVENWRQLGIKENQLIPDKSRNTLLALNIFGIPTPWGYRNEILYEHKGKLIDVGTFEYLYYRPIFDKTGQVINIKKWEHCFVVSAIGIERMLMVINDYSTITDCNHISSVCDLVVSSADNKNLATSIIFTEALRAIHRIISDCGGYDKLSRHRKQKIRNYFHGLRESSKKLNLNISHSLLETILRENANQQSYYPELTESVQKVIEEIFKAKERFESDRSRKQGGVAQQ